MTIAQVDKEITVGARLTGDMATWFEEYRWTKRMTMSDVVREAIEEYRQRHTTATPMSEQRPEWNTEAAE